MKKIGWFTTPVNPAIENYRGLYRNNDLIEYTEQPIIGEAVLEFLEQSHEGMNIDYSSVNLQRVLNFFEKMNRFGWQGEIVSFSSLLSQPGCSLLGFDVCADSLYYSPLGDHFLCPYQADFPFHQFIGKEKLDLYCKYINENGLFANVDTAISFAHDCLEASKQHEHMIETETTWRPIPIELIKAY